jgi:Trypsin-like peptidase domain
VYLVTAKHCVEKARQAGSFFARINSKTGSILYQELKGEWLFNEDDRSDVAVLPFEMPDQAQFAAIPISMLATDEVVREKRIGAGDNVVVTGLFTKRSGKTRNIPVLRAGIISAMPVERERDEEYREAYLIEMRSTGGLSGSPVFVVKDWFVDPDNKTPNLGLPRFSYVFLLFLLIGLVHGHWDGSRADIADDGQRGAEAFNLGIAITSPIQECLQILNGEELTRERKTADAEWQKKHAPKVIRSGDPTREGAQENNWKIRASFLWAGFHFPQEIDRDAYVPELFISLKGFLVSSRE